MKKIFLAALLLALPSLGYGQESIQSKVDAYIAPYLAVKDFSGVVLIAQGDTILAEKAYGMADFERKVPNRIGTAFRIASLSKTFTAAAIAILIERGKVNLSDPLTRYIPGFPNGEKITVNHLLLHKSGVGQLDSPELQLNCSTTSELVARLEKVPLLFPPGTDSQYSNEGYVLLAAIIERASGMTYESFLKANIFAPLGMRHTGTMCTKWPVARHANGYISGLGSKAARLPFNEAGWNGPGSIYSTAGDLYLWLKAVAENRLFHFDLNPWPYGWGRRDFSGRKFADQTGELRGFTSHMAVYPKEKLFFVFLSNVESGFFNRLEKDFEALMFGGTPSAPPIDREVLADTGELKDYVGSYTTPSIPVPIELTMRDDHLWMRWGKDPFWRPLMKTGKDQFFVRAEYAGVHFERDEKGRVEKATWTFGEGTPFVLTKN